MGPVEKKSLYLKTNNKTQKAFTELSFTAVAAVKILIVKRKGKLWGRRFNIDCICFFFH